MPDSRTQDEQAIIPLIGRINRTYRRMLDRLLAAHGLSDAQALPVMMIARLGGGIRQGVLAHHLAIEAPSLVRQLDQLCAVGLVERRDDPKDGRAKALYLSDEGRTLAAEIETLVGECRERMLSYASDEDLAAALRVLSGLEAKLERELGLTFDTLDLVR